MDCSEHFFSFLFFKMEEGQDISFLLLNGQRNHVLCADLGRWEVGRYAGSGGFWAEDEGVSLCFNPQGSITVTGDPEV